MDELNRKVIKLVEGLYGPLEPASINSICKQLEQVVEFEKRKHAIFCVAEQVTDVMLTELRKHDIELDPEVFRRIVSEYRDILNKNL